MDQRSNACNCATEVVFVARPVAEVLSDTGISYEQILSDWDLASRAISNAAVGRTLVTFSDTSGSADRLRQSCGLREDAISRQLAVAVEQAGGEVVCLDYPYALPWKLLADGILVDFDRGALDSTAE